MTKMSGKSRAIEVADQEEANDPGTIRRKRAILRLRFPDRRITTTHDPLWHTTTIRAQRDTETTDASS